MFDWYNYLGDLAQRLALVEWRLAKLERKTMTALADLAAQVAANTSAEHSAVELINGLAKQITDLAANGANPAELQALSDQLKASATDLAAAITANTPAAPNP